MAPCLFFHSLIHHFIPLCAASRASLKVVCGLAGKGGTTVELAKASLSSGAPGAPVAVED